MTRGLIVNGEEWPLGPCYTRLVEQSAPRARISNWLTGGRK